MVDDACCGSVYWSFVSFVLTLLPVLRWWGGYIRDGAYVSGASSMCVSGVSPVVVLVLWIGYWWRPFDGACGLFLRFLEVVLRWVVSC